MSHLPAARYILDPAARTKATAAFLREQLANRGRDHRQWVKGQKRKQRKRFRLAKLQHQARRRQWSTR